MDEILERVEEKTIVEIVDDFIATFTIEWGFVTIQVVNQKTNESVIVYMRLFGESEKLRKKLKEFEEDGELRKEIVRVAIKMMSFFRKYHRLLGNVIQLKFDLTPEELEKRIKQTLGGDHGE
jgi:endonuclease V-like protein UPF0215 family